MAKVYFVDQRESDPFNLREWKAVELDSVPRIGEGVYIERNDERWLNGRVVAVSHMVVKGERPYIDVTIALED